MNDFLLALAIALAIIVGIILAAILEHQISRRRFKRKIIRSGRSISWSDALKSVNAGQAIFVRDQSACPEILWLLEKSRISDYICISDPRSVGSHSAELFRSTHQAGRIIIKLPSNSIKESIRQCGSSENLIEVFGEFNYEFE